MNKLNSYPIGPLFTLVLLIVSLPLLKIGFTSDDVLNSLIKGLILVKHTTLYAYTKEIVVAWLKMGRLFPFAFISTYTLFYFVGTHVLLFNVIHWIANLATLYLTTLFLRHFSIQNHQALLFSVLFLMGWSSAPGSPFVAYGVLLPLVVSFMMICLNAYLNYLDKPSFRDGFISLLFYACALMTYEVAFALPPALMLLNKWKKDRFFQKNGGLLSAFFALTFLYLFAAIYLRQHYPHVLYPGIALGGNFQDVFLTFLKQLRGEVPYINFHHRPISNLNYVLAVVLLISSGSLVFKLLTHRSMIQGTRYLFGISLIFQLIPAFLIGLSDRYQHLLNFGKCHIPIFLQGIGFSIMLLLFIQFILKQPFTKRTMLHLKLSISLTISLLLSLNFLSNGISTEIWNNLAQYSRDIYEEGLSAHLLNHLPKNSILVKKEFQGIESFWNSTQHRAQLIGRSDILLFNLNGEAPTLDAEFEHDFEARRLKALAEHRLYFLEYEYLPSSPRSGYIFLSEVKSMEPTLTFKQPQVFYVAKNKVDVKRIRGIVKQKYGMHQGLSFFALPLIYGKIKHTIEGWAEKPSLSLDF